MILCLDWADVDGNHAPDLAAAKGAGASVAIRKASEHVYPERGLARDWRAVMDADLVRGAYMFPSMRRRDTGRGVVDSASPEAQVRCLADALVSAGRLRPGFDLPPIFDLEFPGRGVQDTGRSRAECLDWCLRAIRELGRVFGCAPIVYTSLVEWSDPESGLGLGACPEIARCPLWLKTPYRLAARQPVDQVIPVDPDAQTPRHPRGLVPEPWRDPGSAGWWLQQYQGDATGFTGFSSTVDLSRFRPARLGDRGPHVAWLARKLLPLGLPYTGISLRHDDAFDDVLDQAVRQLQADRGLVIDGVVGPRTFAAVAWLP